jgi:two-component system, LytTR family, sensor kinase
MTAPPRLDWRFITVATLIITCLVTLASLGRPGAPPFAALHDRQTITWIAWLLLTPAIIAAARRFPFGEGSPMRWLGRHVLLGATFSAASVAVSAAIRWAMSAGPRVGGAPLTATLASGLLVYALIAVSYQAVAYHRSARERDAVAAGLRADLAEAKLATIEGQLHPHFLFNALNSIAALMRVDPRKAETMLEQLSELLRATLRTNPMQEVRLDDALHLTEQYLAIERVRFQQRLEAVIEASGAARRGKVPQLILQPLVENAVRHGIAPLESGGLVRVTAVVENDTLVMTVEDNGVGIGNAPAERAGSGLGLKSVRSLLAHLYGADHRFDVRARTPSGTTVTIAIPYRPATA